MINEDYFVFYEGEDSIIEAPYFCMTIKDAEKHYNKLLDIFALDAKKLYIAKIIRRWNKI